MLKGLVILAGSVFIGAVVAEFVRTTCPGYLEKVRAKLGEVTETAKMAFNEGFQGALGEPEADRHLI